jgi:hypothetical protein
MRSSVLVGLLLAAATLVGGVACRKAPPQAGSSNSAPIATPAPAAPVADVALRKPKNREPAVYVDGTPVAAVRILELPASLPSHKSPIVPGPVYYMGEYIKALGIDVAKVKALHVHGGASVATLDGDEFRRVQNSIHFAFAQGDRGKARIMFVVSHLKAATTVDMISAVTVYIDKEPPTYNKAGYLTDAEGNEIEGIPYASKEISKGTRVYVDGKLAATVKRKELPNGLLLDSNTENPRYSFSGYLSSIGVDAKQAKAIDFIRGDEVILREDDKAQTDAVAFSLPRHSHGRMAVPAGEAKAAKVSAIQVFVKNAPPARTIVQAKDDGPDDAKQGQGGGQGGSGEDDEL